MVAKNNQLTPSLGSLLRDTLKRLLAALATVLKRFAPERVIHRMVDGLVTQKA